MKVTQCRATNFGSYKDIAFNFDNLGLSLIYGPTGSGKSTLCDIACWALYGTTAKEGSVDEVRSWLTPYETTEVSLEVETSSGIITVHRTRGRSSDNDLYWLENDLQHRGKDLSETQKLLEARLQVTAKQFLSSAYFSEFSSVGGFFKANSKQRRSILEEVTNLEFPVKLALASQEAKKEAKAAESTLRQKVEFLQSQIGNIKHVENMNRLKHDTWDKEHQKKLRELEEKSNRFIEEEQNSRLHLAQKAGLWVQNHENEMRSIKSRLNSLAGHRPTPMIQGDILRIDDRLSSPDTCGECGQPKQQKDLYALKTALAQELYSARASERESQTLNDSLSRLRSEENPYLDTLEEPENVYYSMLMSERKCSNPFADVLIELNEERQRLEPQLQSKISEHEQQKTLYSAAEQLYDLSFVLRGKLLHASVAEIESKTNYYLETYFDSEISLSLTIEGSDKLTTTIRKSGYECVYTQLSKGQRGLLRLCFSVAVMEISANKAGQHFDCLMYDEALDGLDSELKVKAYGLFQELSTRHSTILLIEHASEFQNLFENKYAVSLTGDESVISHE